MKENEKSQVRTRAWILLIVFFFVGFIFLIGRLFKIQVIEGERYKELTLRQQVSSSAIEAKRGKILDRNEKILAQSAVVWNVCISPNDIKETEWEPIAIKLSEILGIPKEEILINRNIDTYYAKIKTGIDNATREKIVAFSAENKLRSIYFEEAPKRYYTYDSLASTLIGFTNNDNHGAYGLESYYDSILSGTPGVKVASNAEGTTSLQSYSADDGYSIMLTIDEVVQASLEKHLEMAMVEHNVRNGAAGIIMNIQTGEIIAMASMPDFNPNSPYEINSLVALAELEELTEGSEEYQTKLEEAWYYQWRNKAISDPYEPGSVYKIITAAIALEENNSYLDDQFYCSGSIEVADRTMNCWLRQGHGGQDFYGIMRNSCNPAFVTLGLRNGAKPTYDYMTSFGLGKLTGIDLPGEAVGIIHADLTGGSGVQLASTSFGQSFKTTPIQLITGVSAAINGGYLVEPYIVRQIMDSQGNVVETIEPKIKRQVISEATSTKLKDLVEAVVSNGSGRHANVPGYRIGGKTGTSEKLDLLPRKEYVLSFVGFAPMENPTYACLVLLDEPEVYDAWASVIAAPVVGAIFQEILPYLGVEPRFSEEELAQVPIDVPYLMGKKPHDAQAELTALGLKTNIVGQGQSVIRQVPLASEKAMKGSAVTLFCSEDELNENIIMPNLKDIPKEQAKKQLQDLGLNVSIEGATTTKNTIVSQQWPEMGEKLTSGDVVKIVVIVDNRNADMEILPELPPVPVVIPEDSVLETPEENPLEMSEEPAESKRPETSIESKPDPIVSKPPSGNIGEQLDR